MSDQKSARSIGLDEFIEIASSSALRALAAQKQASPQLPFRPHIWIGIIASEELGQVLERGQAGKTVS